MSVTLTDDDVRPYRVDLDENIYTALRAAQGFEYDDTLSEPASPVARRLFIPGCSLSSYSQELTLAVYHYLGELGEVDGLSLVCCGNILNFVLPHEERTRYAEALAARLVAHGVTSIITACPNCYQAYRGLVHDGHLAELEVLAVSEVLVAQDIRFIPTAEVPFKSVCIHDSCPDRASGVFATSVRELFAEVELREMEHHHGRSRCCGLGKLLPVRDPTSSARLMRGRLAEFDETEAECLITCCANCAQALRGAASPSYHYLELIFGIPLDWDAVADAYSVAAQDFQPSLS
jgi:Fe-S oxidoreductase